MSEPPLVLVVEDEYFLQADLEKALTGAGFAAAMVSSGEEALTLLIGGTNIYRALVTDVRLPGASGWAVARRIREKEPAIPCHLRDRGARRRMGITRRSEQYPHIEALRGGAVGYRACKSPQHRNDTDRVRPRPHSRMSPVDAVSTNFCSRAAVEG